jgi:regulator of sigma E protease
MIGVSLGNPLSGERESMGPVESAVRSGEFIVDYVTLFVRVPAMLISGEMSASEARPVSIVGISQIAGQAAETSATNRNIFPLLSMIAFVNIALGLTNLLPLPALDGGRIMFVLIEAVRGRRIEPEREGMVHIIGMIFLLGLMVLMIVQDIINPIIPF